MNEKLEMLLGKARELDKEMQQAVLEIVQAHGGLIRTEDETKFGLYALCLNEFTGDVYDEQILAVAEFESCLAVLTGMTEQESIVGISDEELLERDNWRSAFCDSIVASATLTELCKGIMQYVEPEN
jgi:hypothetical protein